MQMQIFSFLRLYCVLSWITCVVSERLTMMHFMIISVLVLMRSRKEGRDQANLIEPRRALTANEKRCREHTTFMDGITRPIQNAIRPQFMMPLRVCLTER